MDILRQSTEAIIVMGPMLNDADGNTPETTLTISQADIRLSKNGGVYSQTNNATGATHMEFGRYSVTLDIVDTATLGKLRADIHESGALAVWREFTVVPANVYDSLVLGTDTLHADVTKWLGSSVSSPSVAGVPEVDLTHIGGVAQSATDLKDFADAGYDPATNKVQGVVLTDTCTTTTTATNLTNAPTAGDLTATMKASVNTEADTALSDIKLDHLIAVADADDAVNDCIIAKLAASDGDWSTFVNTSDALQAIRDRGDTSWVTGAGGSDRLLMVDTTIATLASQTSFTLTAGSADDDAYNNCTIIIEDASTATQKAMSIVSAYTGATKTITLQYDPAIFTITTTDKVYILAENALKATLANRQLNVAADGDIAGNIDGSVASVVGHTAQTGDNYARLGAPAGASVSADILTTDTNVDAILLDTGTDGVVVAAASKSGYALSSAGVDAIQDDVIEGTLTSRQIQRILLAALAGKTLGGGTTTLIFRDAGDLKARITATVDANRNRIAMTLDGS